MVSASVRRHVAAWATVAVLFGLAWWLFARGLANVRSVNSPHSLGAAAVGSLVPEAPLIRLDGTSTSLRAFVGHPLWINFFATWCRPCKAELPEIERRYNAGKTSGLVVVGIDQQESASEVSAFARRYSATYPLTIDEGPAAVAFHVRTIPVSVFVDSGGTIRRIHIGQMAAADMDAALAQIIGK